MVVDKLENLEDIQNVICKFIRDFGVQDIDLKVSPDLFHELCLMRFNTVINGYPTENMEYTALSIWHPGGRSNVQAVDNIPPGTMYIIANEEEWEIIAKGIQFNNDMKDLLN